jgi:hypothetical protein
MTNDWIYNLNVGNVMHLSPMNSDELAPLEKESDFLKKSMALTNTVISAKLEGDDNKE